MCDEELYRLFGTTEGDVNRTVDKVEAGDYSDFDFSQVMQGRPMEKERWRRFPHRWRSPV